MKKNFALVLFAVAAALAIPSVALADLILPPTNADYWDWTGYPSCATSCGTTIQGPLDGPDFGSDTAVNLYISSIAGDIAALWWGPEQVGGTLGTLAGFSASVVNTGPDQPYYATDFYNPGGIPGGTTGDVIEMIEFEVNSLSGPGGDTIALDPATTLFNIWDATTGGYIAGGQQNAQTLDYWLMLDPALSNVQTWIGIQIGAAGGCPSEGSCAENLTINSADVSYITPEPASILLFGTGLAGLAGILRRRRRG